MTLAYGLLAAKRQDQSLYYLQVFGINLSSRASGPHL